MRLEPFADIVPFNISVVAYAQSNVSFAFQPVSSSLQCIFHCLSSLPPLPLELELSVIKRCAAAFTQSGIANGNVATKEPYEQENVELLVSAFVFLHQSSG